SRCTAARMALGQRVAFAAGPGAALRHRTNLMRLRDLRIQRATHRSRSIAKEIAECRFVGMRGSTSGRSRRPALSLGTTTTRPCSDAPDARLAPAKGAVFEVQSSLPRSSAPGRRSRGGVGALDELDEVPQQRVGILDLRPVANS